MLAVILTVLSPYTAFLPMLYISIKTIKKNEPVCKNPWNIGLIVLFYWSMIVGVINKNLFSAFASFMILGYFSVSVYIHNNYNEKEKIERLFQNLVLASVISSAIGIIEKISAEYFNTLKWGYVFAMPSNIKIWDDYRISSTFGNPNVAGNWFAIMVLVGLYFYDISSGRKKSLYALAVCLFVIMLDLTGSRGAGLGLLLGIPIFALLNKNRKDIGFPIFIFFSVLLLIFIIPEVLPLFNKINNSMNHGLNHSLSGRQEIWKSCINMFKSKPITGWGILGIYFSKSYVFRFTREPHAHNLWLTIATTLGIVGLFIYLYMKYYLYESIVILLKNNCSLAPLLASIQALVVGHGLVDFTIMAPQGGIAFILCSSLISGLAMQYTACNTDEGYMLPSMHFS